MNCLKCEVYRAKLLAAFMWAAGKKPDAIADALTESLGARYYVDSGAIWRAHYPRSIKISG